MSDAVKIGQLIDDKQHRDAIHIAICPVIAVERLTPGQDIGFTKEGDFEHVGAREGLSWVKNCIGIVDPFLRRIVYPGERFFMFLYPNTITALRHEWTHPAFEIAEAKQEQKFITESVKEYIPATAASTSKEDSIVWLKEYAASTGLSYQEVMEAADAYVTCGDYLCDGGRWEGEYVPDDFWNHYQAATGKFVDENSRGSFFSCSC